MRVIVNGAYGFLGTHLCARLEALTHEVIRIGRHNRPDYDRTRPVDAIINCAGQLYDHSLMVEDNLALTFGLLEASREASMPRFIQVGSSSETGPTEGLRSETTFCRPSNLYEATKLAATNLCLGYASEYNMDVVVARPFTLYGPGDRPRKMLPTLWRAWVEEKEFVCHPGGHDWIHVDDFVEGLVLLLEAPRALTQGEIYHFGTGVSTPNEEVISLFNTAVGGAGVKTVYASTKLRPHDVSEWAADNTKARALGWTPNTSLSQGIRRFVDAMWFKEEVAPGL